jgi:hypothetical protein
MEVRVFSSRGAGLALCQPERNDLSENGALRSEAMRLVI